MADVCANCEDQLMVERVEVGGATYCCLGCSEGGPCICVYERRPRRPSGWSLASGDSIAAAWDPQPLAERRQQRSG